MTEDETQREGAVSALYLMEHRVRSAVLGQFDEALDISSPMKLPSGDIVVHACLAGYQGGLADHLTFGQHEIKLNALVLHRLVDAKGRATGAGMVNKILDDGARLLNWSRAGRLRRLWWAWRGGIPLPPGGRGWRSA